MSRHSDQHHQINRMYRRMRVVASCTIRGNGERFSGIRQTAAPRGPVGFTAAEPRGFPTVVISSTMMTTTVNGTLKMGSSTSAENVYFVNIQISPGPIKPPVSPAGYTTSKNLYRVFRVYESGWVARLERTISETYINLQAQT